MKIGIFTDTYKPQVNGVVTSITVLERELRKKGHKVYIITTSDPEVHSPESNVLRLPSLVFRPAPQYRLGMIYSNRVINKIKKLNLDIIHSQTEWGVGTFSRFAAKRLNIPLVHTYHTLYEYYTHYVTKGHFKKQARKLAQKISKFYCDMCDSLVVPTEKVEKIIKSYGVEKDIYIIPTGIDVERFYRKNYTDEERQQLRHEYGIQDDEFLCVYIGRVAKEKSIDYLIESFAKIDDEKMKLLIIGKGPDLEDFKLFAEQFDFGGRVIFSGEIPYEKIPIYYQIGDVFLNASISETQGLTFIEAMAAEVIVNARFDENLEKLITKREAGLLYKDTDEFLSNIKTIKADKELVKVLKNNALEISKEFSAEAFGVSIENVYYDTIKEFKHGKNFTFFGGKKFIQQIRRWKGFRAPKKGPWS